MFHEKLHSQIANIDYTRENYWFYHRKKKKIVYEKCQKFGF